MITEACSGRCNFDFESGGRRLTSKECSCLLGAEKHRGIESPLESPVKNARTVDTLSSSDIKNSIFSALEKLGGCPKRDPW